MADQQNTIAENAPIRVRFKHAGMADDQGVHRPICQPNKIKLQTVKHEKDVTCPHCLEAISNFKGWMALQIEAGREPEDALPLVDRIWAVLNRDGQATLMELCTETKANLADVQKAASALILTGGVVVDGLTYKLAGRG